MAFNQMIIPIEMYNDNLEGLLTVVDTIMIFLKSINESNDLDDRRPYPTPVQSLLLFSVLESLYFLSLY